MNCACILHGSMKQLFMRRVHAEKTWSNPLSGSRAKQILLGLCAARVIYPASITNCCILPCRERALVMGVNTNPFTTYTIKTIK